MPKSTTSGVRLLSLIWDYVPHLLVSGGEWGDGKGDKPSQFAHFSLLPEVELFLDSFTDVGDVGSPHYRGWSE
jgi:hypothetical protein